MAGVAAVRQLRRIGSASSNSERGATAAGPSSKPKAKAQNGRRSLMDRAAAVKKPTGLFRARAGMSVSEQAEALAAMSSGAATSKAAEVCHEPYAI